MKILTTPAVQNETAAIPRMPSVREGLVPRTAAGVVAAILIALAAGFPVWEARLSAPQYPGGLRLSAYGSGKVIGDIREINELNHYVGMKTFSTSKVPEKKLWLPTIALGILGAIVSIVAGRRFIGRLARLGIWLMPVGALADVQYRLFQYGHSVQPDAPIRIDPFTPWVIGKTHVLNFTTWAYPGAATMLLFLAAAVITFTPWAIRYSSAKLRDRAQ